MFCIAGCLVIGYVTPGVFCSIPNDFFPAHLTLLVPLDVLPLQIERVNGEGVDWRLPGCNRQ